MDLVQILNGTAALIAFITSQVSLINLQPVHRNVALAVHVVHSTILLWYVIVNLIVGLAIVDIADQDIVPYFRWAFAPLIITYSVRQVMASRNVVRVDTSALR